ncbi:MAG: hypothetical protein Q9177_005530, partial [Variospora cf. flavescens]
MITKELQDRIWDLEGLLADEKRRCESQVTQLCSYATQTHELRAKLRTHATELDDLKMNSGLVFAEHTKKQNESITTLEEKLSVFSNKETTLRKKADAARSAFRDIFELIQHPPKVGSVAKEQVQTTAIQPSTSVSANSISLVKSQRSVNEESNAAANNNKQNSMPASSTINKAHPTPPQTQLTNDDDDGDDDGEWVEEDAGGEEPNNDEPWE